MCIGVFFDTELWLKYVKKLGYKVIATHPIPITGKIYYNDVKDYIDIFYEVSYFDFDKLLDIAKENNVDMIVSHPCSNDALIAAGYINTNLNLKGISYDAVLNCSSKYDFHSTLVKYDLSRPNFTIKYSEDMDYDIITYPCIVKPNFGAGSVGVKLIHNKEELIEFFKTKERDNGYILDKKKYDYYLIQHYVKGSKILACHGVVHSNRIIIFGKTIRDLDKEKNALPYFYGQEFITSDDDLTPYTYKQLNKLLTELKINNTPFDLEIMVDENNDAKTFIELNLRPAEKGFNHISGRDGYEYCIKEQVKLGTDISCNFSEGKIKDFIGIKYFRFKPGTVRTIKWPDLPNNTLFFDTKLKRDSIIEKNWSNNEAHKNGSIILLDKNIESIHHTLNSFINGINIIYY